MRERISIILQPLAVVVSVLALVGGVTYAALTSTATLSDNTISTANASLLVYDGTTFSPTAPGFTVTNVIPGVAGTSGTPGTKGDGVTEKAYFKNAGDTPVTITAHIPTLPAAPASGYGFSGFENATVNIYGEACDENVQTNIAALNAGQVAVPCSLAAGAQGDNSTPNTPGNYDFTFNINDSAVNGSSAGVGPFDIVFTGTATNPAP